MESVPDGRPVRVYVSTLPDSEDAQSFENLYDAHAALCYRLARRVVGDEHLANDVVQEVFLAVWSGRAGTYDAARGSVRSWLMRVTHHRAVDVVRRNHRHASRNAGPSTLDTFLAADANVEDAGWAAQRRIHVVAALASLTVVQRQVLEFAYFGGFSQSEIASLTGVALGTVKTRTLSALRQLRTNLDLRAIVDSEGWTSPSTAVVP